MGTRHNGKDMDRLSVIEQGLNRFFKVPVGRKQRIAFVCDLVRRLHKAAPFVTERDDEIAQAVLRGLDFTQAALDLAPDNPESMRSRISKRVAYFERLCDFFFADLMTQADFGRKRGRPAKKRTRSRAALRAPHAHVEANREESGDLGGHITPIGGRAKPEYAPATVELLRQD
jgi:hypothetical protein